MAKTIKKTEVKKPKTELKVNLSIDELYIKFHSAETMELKIKYHNLIKNLL